MLVYLQIADVLREMTGGAEGTLYTLVSVVVVIGYCCYYSRETPEEDLKEVCGR